jgi:hypothetical protein
MPSHRYEREERMITIHASVQQQITVEVGVRLPMQRIGYIPGFATWFFITSRQFGVLVFFLKHISRRS